MMKMINNQPFISCASTAISLSALIFLATGCGELKRKKTGADSPVSVKFLADSTKAPEAGSSSDGSTTPSATAEPGGVGTIKGKVVISGGTIATLPALFAKGAATKDPSVCGLEEIPDEKIVVKDGALANVFIYLEKAPKGAAPPAALTTPQIFDQKVCVFLPHAMIVRTKTPVKVLNADGAAHNTHTYPDKNGQFNSVVVPNDRVGVDLVYQQPEKVPFSVGCDIHPWMTAFHLPLDHSFAALSAADGTFEIKDLPAGKHQFKVWHEVGKMVHKAYTITVKAGDNDPITIDIPATSLQK